MNSINLFFSKTNLGLKKIRFYCQLVYQYIFRYHYKAERYTNTFLTSTPQGIAKDLSLPTPVIYTFWTGENEMSENRKAGLKSLIKESGVEVKLITPDNLDAFVLTDYPLHPAYKHLSLVHKSDYLRCYFMHHYGGGYSDVKKCTHSWVEAFTLLQNSNKWILGYRELRKRKLAPVEGNTGKDMKKHFLFLVGNGAYICKSHSPFTKDWYNELHVRMDYYAIKLAEFPGNTLGDNEGYPIPWTNILGDIFHPLCLKYMDHLYYSNIVLPNLKNYR